MDNTQFDYFLANNLIDQGIKVESPLFSENVLTDPVPSISADISEFPDYYHGISDSFNVYLVNEEIASQTHSATVSNEIHKSSVDGLVNVNHTNGHQEVGSFLSTGEVSDGDDIEEIFITVKKDEGDIRLLMAEDSLRELELDNESVYLCTACKATFDSEDMLSFHQFNCLELQRQLYMTDNESSKVLPTTKPTESLSFPCSECGATFKSQSGLTKHSKVHSLSSLNDQHGSNGDTAVTPKPYACHICHLKFSREKALYSHERIHETEKYSTLVFDCKNCGKTFTKQRLFEHHFVKCISAPKSKRKSSSSGNHPVSNPITSTSTQSNALSTPKPAIHPCSECSKMFSTKQKMYRHMWIHRKKAFSCEICAMSFGQQHELDEHRLSQHAEESPYLCSECGKSFASRQGLWEHNRIHSNNPNLPYSCTICAKTFSSRQGFLIHNRTHTGEKPFQCNYCDKSFRDGGTLRKHQRIHTGERPHKCPLCEKGFNQKVVLREHIRWVHASNKNEYPDPPPYYCCLCSAAHTDREELCTHIVKHSDQIAAFNKENSKQTSAASTIAPSKDLSPTSSGIESDFDQRTLLKTMPNGSKCNQDVLQRNRIIIQKCKALLRPVRNVVCGNNAVTNTGKSIHTATVIVSSENDTNRNLQEICKQCGSTSQEDECSLKHFQNLI